MAARVHPGSLLPLSRRQIVGGALACMALPSGCRLGASTRPPYGKATPPSPAQLHDALQPRVSELQVFKAKVRDEMTPSAQFAALIQAPGRIHAALFLKGQEIMSLVANERGYGLRYNFNRGLAPGYYHGPKDRCAVQTFLGAPIEIDDLISILLGGGPSSFRADAVLEQGWDSEVGAERVVFYDRRRARSLVAHFLWRDNQWVLYSATGYHYQGGAATWEWGVRHLQFGKIPGAPLLPSKIKIGRIERGMRRFLELSILKASTELSIDAGTADPEGEQGDWEDEGWEQADGSHPAQAPNNESSDASEEPANSREAARKSDAIPAVFLPNPAGLVDKGPLCRSSAPRKKS